MNPYQHDCGEPAVLGTKRTHIWCTRPKGHRGDHYSATPINPGENGWQPRIYGRWSV